MAVPRQPFDNREETYQAYARHVNPGRVKLYDTYKVDVVMGERGGVYFYDAFNNKRFINCHCNGGVFNLGHRNPRILKAVSECMQAMDIGNHHLISGLRAKLAQRLAATTGNKLPGVIYGVSGGEAIDLAIKTAWGVTRRQKIISARGGYHGTTGLSQATGDEHFRDLYGPNLPGFVQVPFNDLTALENEIDDQTAAVILETIPATLGMPIPDDDYLPGVEKLCKQRGAKLLIDEVQTGLGRSGKIWCYQHYGITPDAVITAKALSGGVYPITATLLTREMHALFDDHPTAHISTCGGAEPGCAAALAVLDIIEEPGFLDRVNQVSEYFAKECQGQIFQIRRKGMMMGLKFAEKEAAMIAHKVLFDMGLYALYANNDTSVLQFLMPLIISDSEVDEVVKILKDAFEGA